MTFTTAAQLPLKTFPPVEGVAVGEGVGVGVTVGDGEGVGVGLGVGVGVGVAVGEGVGVGVGVLVPEFRISRTLVTVACMAVLVLKSVMNSHQKTPPILPA